MQVDSRFQHTAARRRLGIGKIGLKRGAKFQHTAARRRLDISVCRNWIKTSVFQHTAARRRLGGSITSLHAGNVFQHTAARRRLASSTPTMVQAMMFQHTAARRRLDHIFSSAFKQVLVSTHSRPKAAGIKHFFDSDAAKRFNTQPPEGGWKIIWRYAPSLIEFQHTAARRRLVPTSLCNQSSGRCFNTQPPEGGWQ